MTPEAQRVAIAEACGWRISPPGPVANGWALINGLGCHVSTWWLTEDEARRAPPSLMTRLSELPDYPNDLNAMHEAEKTLLFSRRQEYYRHLQDIISRPLRQNERVALHECIMATAAQRAEAFLRTTGKWEDAP